MEESQQLKEAGLKITVPRVRILQLLEQSPQHHLSAEDVYKALLESGDDVGLATIYRVLTQFETAGLVTRHNFEGGYSVYELKNTAHHDHLVCLKCGLVDEFMDEIIEQRQQLITEKAGFEMINHSLNIYGTCFQCRQKP